ncbi:unnamed protein product [Bursaphelenchus okinawaensis]|uniref:Uncharacterized protein n=1 Tax=Bursaphelenchus okinawaensis TaxID=465554 RepID=A0A811K180_9BILA|nr:unnamed protein product [Bursaphelenchus okinawaensis]CAG9089573.1 unnamed protein product [Bursaphelenchus okinawaensis]
MGSAGSTGTRLINNWPTQVYDRQARSPIEHLTHEPVMRWTVEAGERPNYKKHHKPRIAPVNNEEELEQSRNIHAVTQGNCWHQQLNSHGEGFDSRRSGINYDGISYRGNRIRRDITDRGWFNPIGWVSYRARRSVNDDKKSLSLVRDRRDVDDKIIDMNNREAYISKLEKDEYNPPHPEVINIKNVINKLYLIFNDAGFGLKYRQVEELLVSTYLHVRNIDKQTNLELSELLRAFGLFLSHDDKGYPRGFAFEKAVREAQTVYEILVSTSTSDWNLPLEGCMMDLLGLAQLNHVNTRIDESLQSAGSNMQALVNKILYAYSVDRMHLQPVKFLVGRVLDALYYKNVNKKELDQLLNSLKPIVHKNVL